LHQLAHLPNFVCQNLKRFAFGGIAGIRVKLDAVGLDPVPLKLLIFHFGLRKSRKLLIHFLAGFHHFVNSDDFIGGKTLFQILFVLFVGLAFSLLVVGIYVDRVFRGH
jgi:hypothetical protein